jgi:hypothetical protein
MATLDLKNLPTAEGRKTRQGLLHKLDRLGSKKPNSRHSDPSTEEMFCQDRTR